MISRKVACMSRLMIQSVSVLFCSILIVSPTGAKDSEENKDRQIAVVETGEIRKGEPGFRALYTMTREGAEAQYLTAAPGMISSSSPMWSHNGRYIAFDACAVIDHVDECKVFVYALEG